jgi:butyryl-CoA dehydrogenase
VSATTIHPGGIKTNIARNARMDASIAALTGEAEGASDVFDKMAMTTPDKAALQILKAVSRDRRRALIGPDAKAIDIIGRLPAALYQRVLVRGAGLRSRTRNTQR